MVIFRHFWSILMWCLKMGHISPQNNKIFHREELWSSNGVKDYIYYPIAYIDDWGSNHDIFGYNWIINDKWVIKYIYYPIDISTAIFNNGYITWIIHIINYPIG